ncbi:MAG: Sec-dependent nitrous-oxide reductase [Bdellovibrionaceae bacterium]|jgi:nitrous-oxide reductase|nr:Sec-dependent nitrous-oxide reductase [Pseudobdellovibrionaceae bacterium]
MEFRVTKMLKVISLFVVAALFTTTAWAQSLSDVVKERGLSDKDLLAAAKTYNPSGKKDEYIVFSSGGQSGQMIVYGVPSMRILKYIAVFTPEPWQGYGYGEAHSMKVLEQGRIRGRKITWGDTHHPALSETKGDYDGQYVFLNDKANPRVAVIDLKTFETVQIVVNPIFKSEHGSSVVTPDTEYVLEAAQYPAPFSNKYVSLDKFNTHYRGGVTYWKFDRKKGRINKKKSFTVEMPPYMQDITDVGKGVSAGWSFTNSINTERYVGGYGKGNTKYKDKLANEAGMSAKDTDYMHVVNWKAAEKLYKAGKFKKVNGHPVISMKDMVKANALFLIPEPKSPHGNDVSPDGRYIIVAGKLDTHASIYDFTKIKALIDKKEFASKDDYGIPILDFTKTLHKQVQLGLGPLHTQFDKEKGIVYTSLYVDSAVARWDYLSGKLIEKLPINYNIGHLVTAEGDTVAPDGKYLVALNKLSIDRFNNVGPLHPQNHQLIDITKGRPMHLLYDMPLPLGEPHYAQMIKADKLKPIVRYKKRSFKHYVKAGKEGVFRKGKNVTIKSTSIRSHFSPEVIEVKKGDNITWHITNVERAQDQVHGFSVDNYNVHASIEPGETVTMKFKADKRGVFPFYCTEFCSALHLEMMGYFLVK